MKKIIFLVPAFFILFSCYHEARDNTPVPHPLFSSGQMVDILTDVQLAEAVIARNRIERKYLKKGYNDSVYRVIFEHYNITAEQLKDNINYYNSDPREMETIYDKVLSNLGRLKSELEMETKKEEIKKNKVPGK